MNFDIMSALSILNSICTIIFAYVAFFRNKGKDDSDEGKTMGIILTELGYIKSGIDDVKFEQRDLRKVSTEMLERLTKVEASTKQAHKRIDDITHTKYRGEENEN